MHKFVLEPATREFAAAAQPPFLYELGPDGYIALAEYDHQIRAFYRLMSRRLGQPLGFAERISQPDSPARHWVDYHRRKHQETRENHWQTAQPPAAETHHSPESATSNENDDQSRRDRKWRTAGRRTQSRQT